ncbi:Probable carbohydrate esterase At4g34215 [Linum perenne]
MAGRGGVINDTITAEMKWDRIVPAQCQPNPSILRLSKELMWVTGQEPLHADIDFTKTNGVGPGMPFANGLLTQDPGLGVRSEAAVAIGGGRIRALLWYQGESDTNNREDADEYKERLETFFYHVREDLQLPSLPIIQVALASSEGQFKETVRNAQLGISIPNLVTVDADGLPIGPDGLHLTTASQVQLGHILADAFLKTKFRKSTMRTSLTFNSYSPPTTNSVGVFVVPLLMSAFVLSLNVGLIRTSYL